MSKVIGIRSSAAIRTAVATIVAVHAAAAAGGDDVAIVPPVDELEILDPRVDPEGKPRAVIQPRPGRLAVEVPPTVIVHHYYYTGDRNFQGPLVPGGPTILVVAHPVTGERLYVEVQMLPGVPRVTYRRKSITYDFGRRRMVVEFPLCGAPKVRYCESDRLDDAREALNTHADHARSWFQRTGVPNAVHHVAHGTGQAIDATADRVHDAGRLVAAPVARAWDALPISGLLETNPAETSRRLRDATLPRELPNPIGSLEGTIPTVR